MSDANLRYPSVWTPWAALLCYKCHGPNFPRSTMADSVFAEHAALQPGRPGEYPAECTKCGDPIWADDTVGPIAVLRGLVGGQLEQTGGMCSALRIDLEGGSLLYATALDEDLILGHYESEDALYSGECLDQWSFITDDTITGADIEKAAALVGEMQHKAELGEFSVVKLAVNKAKGALYRRVRFRSNIDRYPHDWVAEGEMGTITKIGDDAVEILLDRHHGGFAEWDNCLVFRLVEDDEADEFLKCVAILSSYPSVVA